MAKKKRKRRKKDYTNLQVEEPWGARRVVMGLKAFREQLIKDNVCPECLFALTNEWECLNCCYVAWEELYSTKYDHET